MWGPRSIAKLVNITPISLWFMVLITIVTGANLNQLITGGGAHCRSHFEGLFWRVVSVRTWNNDACQVRTNFSCWNHCPEVSDNNFSQFQIDCAQQRTCRGLVHLQPIVQKWVADQQYYWRIFVVHIVGATDICSNAYKSEAAATWLLDYCSPVRLTLFPEVLPSGYD